MVLAEAVLEAERRLGIVARETIVQVLLQLPGGADSVVDAYIIFLKNASVVLELASAHLWPRLPDCAPKYFHQWVAAGDTAAAIRKFFVLAVHGGDFCDEVRGRGVQFFAAKPAITRQLGTDFPRARQKPFFLIRARSGARHWGNLAPGAEPFGRANPVGRRLQP